MRFSPVSARDRATMLGVVGAGTVDELFADIPEGVRMPRALALPGGMGELELVSHLRGLADSNLDASRLVSFLGAGCYDHYVPAVVDHVLRKPEFFTAYTPYQPEVSQGTLQAIYEFQSLVCELTGMDVANASMYDGATAMAEAALLAVRATGRSRLVVASTVHPEWREVLATYGSAGAFDLVFAPASDGVLDIGSLPDLLDGAAALVVADPDFHGCLCDLRSAGDATHAAGALFVVATDPVLLGVLAPPSESGADVVIGEAQPLGGAMSYGGPGLGILACCEKFLRRMPGRIVGRTVDVDGRDGFVLTMQTREQHIRREKATSNICSNHALNALAASVYLAALGPQGLREVGETCVAKAHYLHDALVATGRFSAVSNAPYAREFVLASTGDVPAMQADLLRKGFLAGLDLSRYPDEAGGQVLFSVTEKRTRAEMDRFVAEVSST